MKHAIIADIHSNLEALQAVLADIESQGITQIACLGDIVGYCANPKECLEIVRALNMPCVKGNHDEWCASDYHLEGLNRHAIKAVLWTRAQLTPEDCQWLQALPYTLVVANFTIVHASLETPRRWGYVFDKFAAAASFTQQSTPVCFVGHTHVPLAFMRDSVGVRGGTYTKFKIDPAKQYFINPVSVWKPRDNDPRAAYAIYDLDEATIKLRRVDYDSETTQRKIRENGL